MNFYPLWAASPLSLPYGQTPSYIAVTHAWHCPTATDDMLALLGYDDIPAHSEHCHRADLGSDAEAKDCWGAGESGIGVAWSWSNSVKPAHCSFSVSLHPVLPPLSSVSSVLRTNAFLPLRPYSSSWRYKLVYIFWIPS